MKLNCEQMKKVVKLLKYVSDQRFCNLSDCIISLSYYKLVLKNFKNILSLTEHTVTRRVTMNIIMFS